VTGGARGLELAAAGMDFLGIVAGGWYVAVRYRARVQRKADREFSSFGESPATGLLFSPSRLDSGLLNGQPGEEEVQTGAEELLTARMTRFQEPFLGIVWGWWERMWRSVRAFGWAAVPLLLPAGLVLLALVALWCALLLPLVVIGYLFDTGPDFRLRIVVLAFTLGIVLQILAAAIG
jgi:hypothetical protein